MTEQKNKQNVSNSNSSNENNDNMVKVSDSKSYMPFPLYKMDITKQNESGETITVKSGCFFSYSKKSAENTAKQIAKEAGLEDASVNVKYMCDGWL